MKIGGGQASTKKKQKKSNSKILKLLPNPSAESKSTIRSYSSLSSLSSSSDHNLPPGFSFEEYADSTRRGSSSPPIPIPITPTGMDRRARIEAEERRRRERRKREHNAATKLQAVERGVRARKLAKELPRDTKSKRVKDLLYPSRPLIPRGTYEDEEVLDPDGFGDHGHTNNKKGPAEWVAHELRRISSWSKGGKRRKTKRKPIKINPKMKGVFTRKAKKHKMSVQKYAKYIIKKYKGKTKNKRQLKLLKQAVFAKTAKKWKKRKRKFSRKKRRK